jgi:hypothetical protein
MAMIAIAAAACGRSGPGLVASDPDAWRRPCEDALARAADAPPWRAARTIVDACRPCGVAWDPIVARPAPAPGQVVAVVDACKLDCPKPARAAFFAAISALDEDSSPRQAWHDLARACPAAFASAGDHDRYAGGAWFALEQIARRLPASARAIDLPLPPWSQVGTGMALPTTSRRDERLEGLARGERLATITDADVFLADAPTVELRPGKGAVAIGDWPGERVDLARAPRLAGSYAIVAPIGLDAARLAEIVRVLGTPTHVAVQVPDGTLFGGELAGLPVPSGWQPPTTGTVGDAVKALESGSR